MVSGGVVVWDLSAAVVRHGGRCGWDEALVFLVKFVAGDVGGFRRCDGVMLGGPISPSTRRTLFPNTHTPASFHSLSNETPPSDIICC